MEKIFIYSNNKGKKKMIETMARSIGMQAKDLSPKDLPETVGHIVGLMPNTAKDPSVPAFYNMPELILFSGLSDSRLDEFLDCYKQNQIEPVALKAVVTGYNFTWSLYQLIETLKKEHCR